MTIHQQLQQYGQLIRWNRPVGTLLLLWPALAALWIAANGHPSASITFVFVSGVFVMRAAGCIINDIVDRNMDKHVDRTKTRPITAGKIKLSGAITLMALLLLIALGLVLFLNRTALIIAIMGVVLSCIYPFMKRLFPLPQAILGIVWNLGILMAFAAYDELWSFPAWFLFFIAIFWTIAYDTQYAMCDRADDEKLGLHSGAILFGKNDRLVIATIQSVVIIGLFILGFTIHANAWFHAAVIATTASFIFQQILIRNRDPRSCLSAFSNNHWSWFFIFFGLFLNYL